MPKKGSTRVLLGEWVHDKCSCGVASLSVVKEVLNTRICFGSNSGRKTNIRIIRPCDRKSHAHKVYSYSACIHTTEKEGRKATIKKKWYTSEHTGSSSTFALLSLASHLCRNEGPQRLARLEAFRQRRLRRDYTAAQGPQVLLVQRITRRSNRGSRGVASLASGSCRAACCAKTNAAARGGGSAAAVAAVVAFLLLFLAVVATRGRRGGRRGRSSTSGAIAEEVVEEGGEGTSRGRS